MSTRQSLRERSSGRIHERLIFERPMCNALQFLRLLVSTMLRCYVMTYLEER